VQQVDPKRQQAHYAEKTPTTERQKNGETPAVASSLSSTHSLVTPQVAGLDAVAAPVGLKMPIYSKRRKSSWDRSQTWPLDCL